MPSVIAGPRKFQPMPATKFQQMLEPITHCNLGFVLSACATIAGAATRNRSSQALAAREIAAAGSPSGDAQEAATRRIVFLVLVRNTSARPLAYRPLVAGPTVTKGTREVAVTLVRARAQATLSGWAAFSLRHSISCSWFPHITRLRASGPWTSTIL